MENKTLTAVDWFYQRILSKDIKKVFEQAKAMEKEQMHKCASFWRGKEDDINKPMFNLYYNETYNK